MMKKISIISVLILICSVSIVSKPVFGGTEKITIAVDDSYPPYMYGSVHAAKGLYPELLKAVFARMGTDTEILAFPWKRALRQGETGKAAVGGIYKNNKRLEIYDYSEPLFTETLAIYVKKGDSFSYNQISDLKGKKIGVNLGWSYGEEFDKALRENLFVADTANNNLANFKKLLAGRIDCIIADQIAGSLIIHDEKCNDKVEKLNNPVTVNKAYIVFSKTLNKKNIINTINITLNEMKKDKTYNKIIDEFIKKGQQ